MPEREVQTGIGAVTVKRPRVRDRDPQATGGRIRFTSSILPPYLRRAKSVEALLPWLYLKGISSGDFSEALAALLGPDAPGLTASTIGRLKAVWWDEYEAWQKRDLSARRYVYFWADGVYLGVGLVWKIEVIDLVRFWCRDGRPKTAIRDNGPLQGRILSRRQGRAGEGGNAPHRQKRYDAVS